MSNYGPYISKITLPNGQSYDIKDQEARDLIAGIAAGGLAFKISTNAASTPEGISWINGSETVMGILVASADTKAFIYLVPHEKSSLGKVDYYREYVTVNFGTDVSPVWAWEFLGSTDINIDDLGDLAYKDSASGTVKVTTADAGSFSNGTVSASASYTPAGTVTAPTITVTPTTASVEVKKTSGSVTAGSAASFTEGAFHAGSCTKAADTFVAPTLTTTVNSQTETLTIGFTAGSFTEGALSYTAPSKDADTFVANTPTSVALPTFESQNIVTGIDSATATQPTFTGTAATISSTGTASGDVTLTKTEKSIAVTVE